MCVCVCVCVLIVIDDEESDEERLRTLLSSAPVCRSPFHVQKVNFDIARVYFDIL